jgi:iron complex transport system permease protein
VTILLSLSLGSRRISPLEIFDALFSTDDTPLRSILFDLRLPRIALAISVGGALAVCGVIFQAVLRNPLAEPYMLGVSNGCAVGAILGFLLGVGPLGVSLMSLVAGAIVVVVVLRISSGPFGVRSESLLLGGVMVAAMCASLIFLLLHLLGPQVRSAIQWTLGDLSSPPSGIGFGSTIMFAVLLAVSFISGDTLNALAMGDEEAASLGINVELVKRIAYLTGSFFVGIAVSFCGVIGFVGLVVPHILRRLVGSDHRGLLPLSVIGGGIFLLLCDTLSRTLMPAFDQTATELPIGAVTALVGAPLFIYLLKRKDEG